MLANDLRIWLSEDEVETFPAWETLPFERVSPTTATMGKRLEHKQNSGGARPESS